MSTAEFGGGSSPEPSQPDRAASPAIELTNPGPFTAVYVPAAWSTTLVASAIPFAQPAYYGYPPAYFPPFVAPQLARRRRPVWHWAVGVLALLVIAGMSAGAGLAVGLVSRGQDTVRAAWRPVNGVAATYQRPPVADAPQSEWTAWATRSAQVVIAAQSKALLAGDETTYVAVADPANTALVTNLKLRYQNLHAMGLGVWQQTVGNLRANGSRVWSADLKIDYCFGDPACAKAELTESTRWSVIDNRLVLSKLDPAGADDFGPRPWESDQLSVKTGKRVVVAATKVNAWRLPDAVTIADHAAAISDTFAKWEPAPSRYVIFFAGPNDWRRWYGMDEPEWAAAWSIPVAESVTEIVVRSDVVSQSDLTVLLTHEMTHVTTLAGPRRGATDDAWWLIEGIAEYASHLEVALRDYDGVVETRQYVKSAWNGDPAVAPPAQNANQVEAAGKYGVAFLSVRRMADRYGKDQMLDFWGRIVHNAEPLDVAARAAFGVPWSTVRADCSKYVKDQVNALG